MNITVEAFLRCYFMRENMSDDIRPPIFYFGMSKTQPNLDGTGVSEPTIGAITNYYRASMIANNTNFAIGIDGDTKYVYNVEPISFSGALINLGTITHIFISNGDGVTVTGNVLAMGKLDTAKIIDVSNSLVLMPEQLKIALLPTLS